MSSSKGPNKKTIQKLGDKALAFVVKRQGRLSARSIQSFCEKSGTKSMSRETISLVLQDARESFCKGDAHLFLCAGSSCRKKKMPKEISRVVKPLMKDKRLFATTTKCLGPCDHAPVAVLRVGLKSRFFTDLRTEKSTEEFLTLLKRTDKPDAPETPATKHIEECASPNGADSGTKAATPESVALIDKLEPFSPLLGHWKGASSPGGGVLITQTLLVDSKVNGQVVTLSMDEKLGVGDNPRRQSSFVAIAWNNSVQQLEARVYSDHGTSFLGPVLIQGERIIIPDHRPLPVEQEAISAQRIFVVNADGASETLEVNRGNGHYEPFVSILLSKM